MAVHWMFFLSSYDYLNLCEYNYYYSCLQLGELWLIDFIMCTILCTSIDMLLFSHICQDNFVSVLYAGSGGQCDEDGEVQLVGGEHDFEGRVQVCEDRDWTDLCILRRLKDWTANHAKVVCRSLGYSTESKQSKTCHCTCTEFFQKLL